MANYSVFERTPKGSPKSYINIDTGQVISRRQYRNITEVKPLGFTSLETKQRAQREVVETFKYAKTKHVTYHLSGKIADLERAIDYLQQRYKGNAFGVQIIVKYKDQNGKIKHRSAETVKYGNTYLIVENVDDVLDSYDIRVEDVIGYDVVFEEKV